MGFVSEVEVDRLRRAGNLSGVCRIGADGVTGEGCGGDVDGVDDGVEAGVDVDDVDAGVDGVDAIVDGIDGV